jgi:hypothetical protein
MPGSSLCSAQFSNNQTDFNNGTITSEIGIGSPRMFTASNSRVVGNISLLGGRRASAVFRVALFQVQILTLSAVAALLRAVLDLTCNPDANASPSILSVHSDRFP